MSDRFVNLQDHLIGQKQHIHRPARAIRRGEEPQRLARGSAAAADEVEPLEHRLPTLLREAAIAIERAGLGIAVGVRRHRDAGHHEPIVLDDVTAGTGKEPVFADARFHGRFPVHDARIATGCTRFFGKELVPLALRARLCIQLGRCVSALRRGSRHRPEIDQRARRRRAGPGGRPLQRSLQSGR